nr:SDR family NAD(P)-dependent oxidoreductase [Pseudaminobacter soli]
MRNSRNGVEVGFACIGSGDEQRANGAACLSYVAPDRGGVRREPGLHAARKRDRNGRAANNVKGGTGVAVLLLPYLLAQPQAAVVNVSSGLAFVPRADTPTYSATKAAIHSYSISLRHQLRDTAVPVIEVAVATDLTAGQRDNPRAMPLEDFIRESMTLLAADPEAAEILVERVKALRTAEATGRFATVFDRVNPR